MKDSTDAGIYDVKGGGYRLLYDRSPQVTTAAGMARLGLIDSRGELLWGVAVIPAHFEALCRQVAKDR